MIRLYEILFIFLIFFITTLHKDRFKKNIKVGSLFHTVWAVIYFIPAVVLYFVYHSWELCAAIAAMRFCFYNPILNELRGEDWFYLSVNSENPSWWDRVEIGWGKAYPFVCIISYGIFLLINLFPWPIF